MRYLFCEIKEFKEKTKEKKKRRKGEVATL